MFRFLARFAPFLCFLLGLIIAVVLFLGSTLPSTPHLAFLGFHQFRFYSQYRAYMMDVERRLPARLNLTAVDNCCLKWTPDGLEVAAHPYTGSNLEIYLLDIFSGTMQLSRDRYGFDEWVAWSPDGRQVVYASILRNNTNELWLMKADGTDRRQLTFNGGWKLDFAWSPDSKQIAYISSHEPDLSTSQQFDLYTIDVDCLARLEGCNAAQRRLTTDPNNDFSLSWSPDGRSLAYASGSLGVSDIYRIDVESRAIQRLTDHPAIDSNPAWSPDGKQIAFISDREGQTEIYLINPDGSNLRRLTYSDRFEGLPIWLPD